MGGFNKLCSFIPPFHSFARPKETKQANKPKVQCTFVYGASRAQATRHLALGVMPNSLHFTSRPILDKIIAALHQCLQQHSFIIDLVHS